MTPDHLPAEPAAEPVNAEPEAIPKAQAWKRVRGGKRLHHTSLRLDDATLERFRRVKPYLQGHKHHEPTFAEMARLLIDEALSALEKKIRRTYPTFGAEQPVHAELPATTSREEQAPEG